MPTTRRARERAERHRLIIDTARAIAEEDGWDAVTTRRLAEAVGYSQPVLYGHFANREAIVTAVAMEGFAELAAALADAAGGGVRGVAQAYLGFARERPALYDAMFAMPVGVRFAADDTPEELQAGFGQLRNVVGTDVQAEILWATLHGIATLSRAGRFRPEHEAERIDALTAVMTRA